jgi:Holliday junction resolvase
LRIKKHLQKNLGGLWIKVHGSPYQKKGFPDLLGCVDGRYITVEVKTSMKSKLTENQKEVIKNIAQEGGIAIVATTPVEALTLIKELLNGTRNRSKIKASSDKIVSVSISKKESLPIHGKKIGKDSYSFIRDSKSLLKGRYTVSSNSIA